MYNMKEIPMGFQNLLRKRNADKWTDTAHPRQRHNPPAQNSSAGDKNGVKYTPT